MNSKQAKQIPIENFLEKLNHKPVKASGSDFWYQSPLHEDKTASFKVNKILNTWYDFGTGEGGTIIDLACRMFNDDVSQVLKRLSSDFGSYTPVQYNNPLKPSFKQPQEQQLKSRNALVLDKVCGL